MCEEAFADSFSSYVKVLYLVKKKLSYKSLGSYTVGRSGSIGGSGNYLVAVVTYFYSYYPLCFLACVHKKIIDKNSIYSICRIVIIISTKIPPRLPFTALFTGFLIKTLAFAVFIFIFESYYKELQKNNY